MDWREYYERRLVSVDEAAKVVKSGDHVYMAYPEYPKVVPAALGKRADDLENVTVTTCVLRGWFVWYETGMERSFKSIVECLPGATAIRSVLDKVSDFRPGTPSFGYNSKGLRDRSDELCSIDVFITPVSPPINMVFAALVAQYGVNQHCAA